MPSTKCTLTLSLLVLLPGLVASSGVSGQEPEADTLAQGIGPGDVVRMAVRDEPALSGDFPVGEDGSVLLPLIGLIRVENRPFEEVRREIGSALSRELVDPEIQVTPLVRISVLGEVRRPGLFPVDPTQNVGEVLATAGGFTPLADRDDVSLVRRDRVVPLDYDPNAPELRIPLRSGDRVVVGKKGWFEEHLAIFVSAAASVAASAATAFIVR